MLKPDRCACSEAFNCSAGSSTWLFCLPVLNSKILRSTPGAIAEIGFTVEYLAESWEG